MLASSMRGTPLAPRAAGAAAPRGPAPARPACLARLVAPAAPRGPAAWAPAQPKRADALVPTATSPSSAGGAPVAAAAASNNAANAATAAAASSTPAYPPAFTARRLLTFAGIVLGYSSFYLTRNSLTYTAPAMVADSALGLSMTDVGALTSIFPIMYGVSKFASGVLGSRTSPRALLAGGLAATALMNLAFGFSNTMMAFVFFWSVNGMLQVRMR
jgi:OPA family sugar phosphate sensor protein UhpC-like MFS transporter